MAFRDGCMIIGDAALGHSKVKFRPRRREQPSEDAAVDTERSPAAIPDAPAGARDGAELELDAEVLARAEEVTKLLLHAEPPAPCSVPMLQGTIVRSDAVAHFMARHRWLARTRGFDLARPRIVYHWTSEKNFESIARTGLRVPVSASGVAVKHGSSFGVGIYVSPDFRYGEEFFAYGAPAAFMCLALPGKQHFGKPAFASETPATGLYGSDGYDSVIGREGMRGVDEWVFFNNDQLLPCYLVDRLGDVLARDSIHTVLRAMHRTWPEPQQTEVVAAEASSAGGGRWRRHRGCAEQPDSSIPAPEQPDSSTPVLDARRPVGHRRWQRDSNASSA
eukprot:gnl/TRDRNA2_/TRDRNA2_39325_c0_seq1.p1 gnl/TRDRNA2_/TRDRNA2_39325_c0~~gnl/TRDRNA2_/TRDRNA2_39325_c0_seq1.p1  ORF type:complete len:361 (+),score=55.87 gnl/TRDRNA2_/TRDRNA2_39325_c0_seq1:84-1085(+)